MSSSNSITTSGSHKFREKVQGVRSSPLFIVNQMYHQQRQNQQLTTQRNNQISPVNRLINNNNNPVSNGVISTQPPSLTQDDPPRSKFNDKSPPVPSSSPAISGTKSRPNVEVIQLPIINAHEFTPHPKLQVLAAFDTLLVKEDGSLYDNNGRRTSRTATVTSSTESTEGPKDGNRYQVLSKNGTILYVVSEEASVGCPNVISFCSTRRLALSLKDNSGDEIIQMQRPSTYGCFSCLSELEIYSPPGNLIGTVAESCNFIHPSFRMYDALLPDTPLFEIHGPFCTCSFMCQEVDFPVYEYGRSADQIGIISKKWGGIVNEILTDADSFGVSFPLELDTKHKALFLAACFLIDFKHFEGYTS